jgi:hypothetical protein
MQTCNSDKVMRENVFSLIAFVAWRKVLYMCHKILFFFENNLFRCILRLGYVTFVKFTKNGKFYMLDIAFSIYRHKTNFKFLETYSTADDWKLVFYTWCPVLSHDTSNSVLYWAMAPRLELCCESRHLQRFCGEPLDPCWSPVVTHNISNGPAVSHDTSTVL